MINRVRWGGPKGRNKKTRVEKTRVEGLFFEYTYVGTGRMRREGKCISGSVLGGAGTFSGSGIYSIHRERVPGCLSYDDCGSVV